MGQSHQYCMTVNKVGILMLVLTSVCSPWVTDNSLADPPPPGQNKFSFSGSFQQKNGKMIVTTPTLGVGAHLRKILDPPLQLILYWIFLISKLAMITLLTLKCEYVEWKAWGHDQRQSEKILVIHPHLCSNKIYLLQIRHRLYASKPFTKHVRSISSS